MKIPSRRKLAAAGLIIAGLGAFLVPFLLHGPNTQATSPSTGGNNGGGNNNNNSNPGGGTTPSTNPSSNSNPSGTSSGGGDNDDSGGQGSNTGRCTTDSSDPASIKGTQHGQAGNHGKHKGLAKQMADSVQQMFSSIGKHNPAFHEHKSTRTDNDPVHTHTNNGHSDSHSDNDCSDDKDDDNDD